MKIQTLRGRLFFLSGVLASMAYLVWLFEMYGLQVAIANAVMAVLTLGTLYIMLADGCNTAPKQRTDRRSFDYAPERQHHFEGEQLISYYVKDSCGLHPVMLDVD